MKHEENSAHHFLECRFCSPAVRHKVTELTDFRALSSLHHHQLFSTTVKSFPFLLFHTNLQLQTGYLALSFSSRSLTSCICETRQFDVYFTTSRLEPRSSQGMTGPPILVSASNSPSINALQIAPPPPNAPPFFLSRPISLQTWGNTSRRRHEEVGIYMPSLLPVCFLLQS